MKWKDMAVFYRQAFLATEDAGPDANAQNVADRCRKAHPSMRVRVFKRTVRADGRSYPVTVVVVRDPSKAVA